MKKSKNKFYVVWAGKQPGICNSWDDCRKRVEGFEGARFKGFPTLDEAKIAFADNPFNYIGKKTESPVNVELIRKTGLPVMDSISVDAACSGNPGVLEYRGVYTRTGEEIFRRGPFPEGTTNIGEFLAIVTGLAWLKQKGWDVPLYSDSRNGISWTRQKRVNTKLVRTAKNEELFMVVEKALSWLHNNSYETKILKWETAVWGEIPADFGRK